MKYIDMWRHCIRNFKQLDEIVDYKLVALEMFNIIIVFRILVEIVTLFPPILSQKTRTINGM